MPEFGSPFSGLAKDRKLTNEELVRAIRFMIAAEWRIRCKAAPYSGGSQHPNPEDGSTLIRFKAAGFCEVAE